MRVEAPVTPGWEKYRIYDWKTHEFRTNVKWVDDQTLQLCHVTFHRMRFVRSNIEKRERILIIPPLFWIALDPPVDEVGEEKRTVINIRGSRGLRREVIEEMLKELDRELGKSGVRIRII